jgi:cell division protein FtsB
VAERRGTLARRLAIVVAVGFALWFAVQGGEFSTTDLIRQRKQDARISRTIDSLQRILDSLRRYEAAVEHDPAVQERVAREVFGMVRGDKEILYRFIDSSHVKP